MNEIIIERISVDIIIYYMSIRFVFKLVLLFVAYGEGDWIFTCFLSKKLS